MSFDNRSISEYYIGIATFMGGIMGILGSYVNMQYLQTKYNNYILLKYSIIIYVISFNILAINEHFNKLTTLFIGIVIFFRMIIGFTQCVGISCSISILMINSTNNSDKLLYNIFNEGAVNIGLCAGIFTSSLIN